jgi:hypothetical protein
MNGSRSPAGRPAASSIMTLPLASAMAIRARTDSLASAIGMNIVEPGALAIHRFGSSMCGGAAGRSRRSSESFTVCARTTAITRSASSSIPSNSRMRSGVTSRVLVR